MIAVPEPAREAADAAKLPDDLPVVCHAHDVRVPRKSVKVESVHVPCDDECMSDNTTMGAKFRDLVRRSGMTYRDLAAAAGFSAASGVQRYVDVHNDKPMSVDVAKRFASAMAGKGTPPIEVAEIMDLTGFVAPENMPKPNARTVEFEGASLERVRDDLPVFGTALGAEMVIEGERIEQTMLNTGDIIEYRKRPPISHGVEKVYGLYVQGASMYPAHRDGAFLFAQRDARLRVDDDVVVYLRPKDESDDGDRAVCVLVKRLVKRSAQFVELEQYNPARIFRIDMADVLRIDRVLTADDYT